MVDALCARTDPFASARSVVQRKILGEKLNATIEDIKLQYLYPRIDAEVSKHQNHLLKSPFVVHPGTGRVCVPVDPSKVDEFDPETVPTVGMLLRELEKIKPEESMSSSNRVKKEEMDEDVNGDDKENSQSKPQVKEIGWEQTSLKPYVDMFEKHIAGIMKDNIRAKKGKPQEMPKSVKRV